MSCEDRATHAIAGFVSFIPLFDGVHFVRSAGP
jgi:hypothetical protein